MLQFFSASTSIVNSKRAITPIPAFPHACLRVGRGEGAVTNLSPLGEIRKGVFE